MDSILFFLDERLSVHGKKREREKIFDHKIKNEWGENPKERSRNKQTKKTTNEIKLNRTRVHVCTHVC